MELQYSPNSPYVRKVVVLALELGMAGKIVNQALTLSPYEPNPVVTALNPLGKIPVLSDEHLSLFDSTVACEYLSAQVKDTQWFPEFGEKRWKALRCNAIGNGMLEAAQLVRFESSRPKEYCYGKWIDAQTAKIQRSFAYLENNLPADDDIGAIAVACAIGWLDFRFPDLAWRDQAPQLAVWFSRFSERESFASTRHPGQ